MSAKLVCWNCGASLGGIPMPISRHAHCDACHEVLHCCRMCRYYLPDKRPYCDHDRADPPVEKATANFCDYFKPANRFDSQRADKSAQAKDELNSLFGGDDDDIAKDSPDADLDLEIGEDEAARRKLDDLFDE